MKQNSKATIQLIDLFPPNVDTAFGSDRGREIYQQLAVLVDGIQGEGAIGISLVGITKTDASFPRESVAALAKSRRGEQGFYLLDFDNQDLMDNWDYAAKAREQHLIVLQGNRFRILGPKLNQSNIDLISYIYTESPVTTSKVAEKFAISAQSASGRLKKLYNQGLILGSKELATSGGVEYHFTAIKQPDKSD
jgi:predicted DNA-binding transcriptional regulator